MKPWIDHPRTKKPDAMLTLAVWSTLVCLGKLLLNGVSVEILDKVINFGTIDSGLIAAMLAPTLGAYIARKFKDSPKTEQDKPA